MFDLWKPEANLSFATYEKKRQVQATMTTVVQLGESAPELKIIADVETYFAPLFEFPIEIPANWKVNSLTRDGKPVLWQTVLGKAGVNEILIAVQPPLQRGKKMQLVLNGRQETEGWPVEKEPVSLTLPQVKLPLVDILEGSYAFVSEGDLQIIPQEIKGLDPAKLGLVDERLGFKYQDTVFSGSVEIRRMPTRLAVITTSMTRLDRKTLSSYIESNLTVEGGGTRQLTVLLSENSGTQLRFTLLNCPSQIIEQIPGQVKDGMRKWTLRLDQRLRGIATLQVQFSVQRKERIKPVQRKERTKPVQRKKGKEFSPAKLLFPEADFQDGYIALEAAPDQQLTISAKDLLGRTLPDVDPADFPVLHYRPKERIVAAYRFVQPEYNVSFTETQFDRQAIPMAVIEEASVKTILDGTSREQHRATLKFKAVGVQALRLNFSEKTDLWALLLNRKPVEIRRGEKGYLIALPTMSGAPETHQLEIYYKSSPESDSREQGKRNGRFRAAVPSLTVISGTGEEQPISVLKQRWEIVHPPGLAVVSSKGAFAPSVKLDRLGLLEKLNEGITLGSIQKLTINVVILVAVLGVLLFIFMVARKPILWGSILTLVLVAVLVRLVSMPIGCGSREMESSFVTKNDSPRRHYNGKEAAKKKSGENKPRSSVTLDMDGESRDLPKSLAAPEPKPALKTSSENPFDPLINKPGEGRPEREKRFDEKKSENVLVESERESSKSGGLLSLAIRMEQPRGSIKKEFHYLGTASGADRTVLEVTYHNRATILKIRWLMIGLTVLLFWLIRNAPLGVRTALAIVGVMLPIGLGTLVPALIGIFLEGILIGTLIGIALWIVMKCQGFVKSGWERWTAGTQLQSDSPSPSVTAGLLLFAIGASSLMSMTAEAKSPLSPIQQQQISPMRNAAPQNVDPFIHSAPVPAPVVKKRVPTIIVPYKAGTDPKASSRIFLPHKEFLRLYKLAHPQKVRPEGNPIPALLGETLFSAKLDSQKTEQKNKRPVIIKTRIVVLSFRKEPVSIALPFHHVALSQATLDGKKATILADAKTQKLNLIVEGVGPHVFDAEFKLTAQVAGTAGQLNLPLNAGAFGKFSFQLPSDKLRVLVNNQSNTYRLRTDNGKTILETGLPKTGLLSVNWEPEQKSGTKMRFIQTERRSLLRIEDTGVHIQSDLSVQVRQGAMTELQLAISPDTHLRSISGADVGGWQIKKGEKSNLLTLYFRRTLDSKQPNSKTSFQVNLFSPLSIDEGSTKQFRMPDLTPQNVTRATGHIAIMSTNALRIQILKSTGLRQVDAMQLMKSKKANRKAAYQSPRGYQYAFEYARQPIELQLEVTRKQPEVKAKTYHVVSVDSRKIRIATAIDYDLTGAPQSRLALYLPEGYLPLKVESAYLNDWYVSDDEEIILEYSRPVSGRIRVTMNGITPLAAGETDFYVDFPLPLEVKKMETWFGIWFGESQAGRLLEFESWKAIAPATLPREILQLNKKQPRFGFHTKELEPELVKIDLTRKMPQLQGDSVTLVAVTESSVDYGFSLRWEISGASESQFSIVTPAWLKGRLAFKHSAIRQVIETPLSNGKSRWTIHLHAPARKTFFVTASASIPIPKNDQIVAPNLQMEAIAQDLEAHSLQTQRHYAVLVNLSPAQLNNIAPERVETISRKELPIKLSNELIVQAAEIVRLKPKAEPIWKRERFEHRQSAAATVRTADLTTVLERDGSWRTKAHYTIRNLSRQFLAIEIPKGAHLLSVYVNNKPSRAVQTKIESSTIHLIALPKTGAADLSFPVIIIVEGRKEKKLPIGNSPIPTEWEVPVPQVVSLQQSTQYGIPVAHTRWSVFVPKNIRAIPLKRYQKTNLEEEKQGDKEILYNKEQLHQISKFNEILSEESVYSDSQKQRVVDNFKELKEEIHQRKNEAKRFEKKRSGEKRSKGYLSYESRGQMESDAKLIRSLEVTQGKINKWKLDEIQKMQRNQSNSQRGALRQQASPQSSGNEYIQRNNLLIEELNSLKDIDGNGVPNDELNIEELNFANPQAKNSNKRSILPGKNIKGKGKQPRKPAFITGKKDRRRLKENFKKQNDLFNRGKIQQKEDRFQYEFNPQGQRQGSFGTEFGRGNQEEGFGGGQGFGFGGQGGGGFGGGQSGGGFGGGQGGKYEGRGIVIGILVHDNLDEGNMNNLENPFEEAPEEGLTKTTVAQWKTAGGLSLPLEIPKNGYQLVLTKVGGNPKLTLQLQSKESVRSIYNFSWAIAWIVAAGILIGLCMRTQNSNSQNNHKAITRTLLILGFIVYLFTPLGLNFIGLLAIVVSLFLWWFSPQKNESQA